MTFLGIYNLRLISGESIIAGLYESDEEGCYFIANPMLVSFNQYFETNRNVISLSSWLPFASINERHQIYVESILAMSEVNNEMIEYYNSVITKQDLKPEPEPEPYDSVEEIEEGLDIVEALLERSKGKLH